MPTDFQDRVYKLISTIPAGKVVSYGQVADALACRSSQAIGQALKKNPFAPTVPCHRVIRSDLKLGGFFGSAGEAALDRKRALLESEGVIFSGDYVSKECIHSFSYRF